MIPNILGMVIEEVRAIFAPNFFDPIISFAARGYWKLVGCPPKVTKLKS